MVYNKSHCYNSFNFDENTKKVPNWFTSIFTFYKQICYILFTYRPIQKAWVMEKNGAGKDKKWGRQINLWNTFKTSIPLKNNTKNYTSRIKICCHYYIVFYFIHIFFSFILHLFCTCKLFFIPYILRCDLSWRTNKPFTKLRFTKLYFFILELIVLTRGIFEEKKRQKNPNSHSLTLHFHQMTMIVPWSQHQNNLNYVMTQATQRQP